MASINKVILIGNLGRDPEIRQGQSSTIASFSLATTRKYKAQDGQIVSETEWHRLVAFGRLAEIIRDYLKKGSSAYIEGRLRTRKYTDKDGVEKYTTEIIVEMLQLLDRKGDNPTGAPEGHAAPARQAAPAARAPSPAATTGALDESEDIPF